MARTIFGRKKASNLLDGMNAAERTEWLIKELKARWYVSPKDYGMNLQLRPMGKYKHGKKGRRHLIINKL